MSKFPPLPACQGKVEYRSRTEALGAAARYVGRHNTSKLRGIRVPFLPPLASDQPGAQQGRAG